MKQKKRIKALEKEILELKKIIKKDSVTLTDESNTNEVIVISFKSGVFSTDKITVDAETTILNITNSQILN